MRSPFKLNSGWFEAERKGDYTAPNYVAEAARQLGAVDDRVPSALMHAAMRDGLKIGDIELAARVASDASGLAAEKIIAAAKSEAVRKLVEDSTAIFFAHQLDQRPSFILENNIGDKAVFSGLAKAPSIAAAIEAMLDDATAYAAHRAQVGTPPST